MTKGSSVAREFCNHYRGMHQKDSCEAGVVFAELQHFGTKQFHDSCPCFGPDHPGECPHKQYPTPEEIAAREAEIAKRLAAIGKAREAIVEHLGGPWKKGQGGGVGAITCPICEQPDKLHFSRSGYNGHIHAVSDGRLCVVDGVNFV